nr:quinol:electron acceptor oxidoreductase subunit ActD [uncultured Holophaga sp.]
MSSPTGSERVFAVLGLFDSPDALLAAIPEVQGAGLGRLEAYSPYPIHGMGEALKLRRSPLAGMVAVMGVIGAVSVLALAGWTSAVDYPVVTGGKALFSWQAFIPIVFELMVLFATFTAGLGMLVLLNRLPFFGHPLLASRAIRGITRDRFALSIEADGPTLDPEAARDLLSRVGARDLEVLRLPAPRAIMDADFIIRSLGGIILACGAAALITYVGVKALPLLPPFSYMEDQARLDPYKPSPFFADGRGMRAPVAGTVARGHLPLGVHSPGEAEGMVNPIPRTLATIQRGREAYMNRCVLCHGPLADGTPTLTSAYGAKPANLISEEFRKASDGRFFWAVTEGKNAMPAHAADMSEADRWAAIHYIRTLQRAQNAKDSDLAEAKP